MILQREFLQPIVNGKLPYNRTSIKCQIFSLKKLRDSKPEDEIRKVARVRMLTVLSQLDKGRKQSLLQFLHEVALIDKNNPIIHLTNANLSGANLSSVGLSKAILRFAHLDGSDLRAAFLDKARLNRTILRETDLREAILDKTSLTAADLSKADLSGADLSDANLSGATYKQEQLNVARDLTNIILSTHALTNL